MADILSSLKSETADWHARVEASVPILHPDFNRNDYARLLEHFYGFYGPMEEKLATAEDLRRLVPDWEKRHKAPLLKADLGSLGYSEADIEKLPRCDELPPLSSAEEIFGCLYVTEGSTLGGQILARHLKNSLQLSPEAGAAFFHSYGTQTGSMWTSFGATLRETAPRLEERLVVKSAQQTFEAFWLWLGRRN